MTFKRIYEFIIDKAPQLAARNTHIIHEWLKSGYDVEKDIIPAIEQATKNGAKAIHSLAYFSGYIRSFNEKNIKQANKPIERSQAEKDAIKAKNIRMHKEKGWQSLAIGRMEYEWLEQYERENGQVIA